MRDKLEIKALFGKPFLMRFGYLLPVWDQGFQYLPVLPQNGIDVANEIGGSAVALVVVSVAAPVVAEFFINPAFNRFTTIQAVNLLRGVCHKLYFGSSKSVFHLRLPECTIKINFYINIRKEIRSRASVYKRL